MTAITCQATLFDIVKFEQTNDHIPTRDGQPYVKKMAALWFRDDKGQVYVTFTKKTTELYHKLRVGCIGQTMTISGNVKEVRQPDEHANMVRTVLTFVKMGGYKGV